jgi:hypothetical protein
MNLLQDIITYVRRIIKSPSNALITDNLIIDYVNRFWIMDVDARMQLFDLKTKYQFQTQPGVDKYNMPLYSSQTEPGAQTIGMYPVYQGFTPTCYINGIQVPFQTQKNQFFNIWPNIVQNLGIIGIADGRSGPYALQIPIIGPPAPPNPPLNSLARGHIDISGIIALSSGIGTYVDPPVVDNATAQKSIPAVPVTSVDAAVFITTTGSDGSNVIVSDSGQFFVGNVNQGLLMQRGAAPFGNLPLPGGYETSFAITGATQANPCVLTCSSQFVVGQQILIEGVGGMTQLNGNIYTVTAVSATTVTINVDSTAFSAYTSGGNASSLTNYINYLTGQISVIFPVAIPAGNNIFAQCFYYQTGLPRAVLFYNNTITLRTVPDSQYLVELDAYLTPAAFLNSAAAIQFGYMAEYLARGAARKILSDTGDIEQFQFYEPLFKEQELLVWKRSQRQWTASRTESIYSQGFGQGAGFNNNYGGGVSL